MSRVDIHIHRGPVKDAHWSTRYEIHHKPNNPGKNGPWLVRHKESGAWASSSASKSEAENKAANHQKEYEEYEKRPFEERIKIRMPLRD